MKNKYSTEMDEISRQRKRDYYRVISLYETHEFNFFVHDFTNLESEVCCFFFLFLAKP